MINSTYKKANRLLHIIFFIFFIQLGFSQIYPVQVNSNVIPPYLSSVSKYTTTTNQKYLVNIFTNDLNVVNRQVKLKLYIQGNGINAQSAPVVVGANPLFINGGESVQLNNLDLEPYFELQNLQGINPQQYSGVLPQGSYNFCIEVYDFITNQPISQKSCTFFYFIYNEPPLLNLPFNHDVIHFQDPQNIIFTWTPRHSNATNIEYEFTLIELLDNQAPLNYAFIVGAPVWQEVLNNTILNYNFNFPQLTAGKKYAWRVKALTQPGFGEDAVFNNNGYSEIYDFVYAGNCNAPEFVLAQSTSARQAKILWQNNPNHLSNNVKFRKSGTQEWFDAPVANGQALLLDLEPSATYEFQVGGICLGDITSFSAINQFTQPAKDVVAINCGIAPTIDLTNVTLYNEELKKDMVFMAADYSIHIKESQGVGTYTGKGWTRVPFFKNLKIAVEFENIKLNSELKLVEGNVKAQYDPSWGNILDVNEVIDVVDDILDPLQASKDVHSHQVDFVIGSTANITVQNGQIIITTPQGTTGAIFDFDQGENTTITDANGTVYTVDPKGNVILGQQGTGIASSSNTENTNSDGKVTALSAIGAKVVFKRSSSSKAFDDTSADYTNLPSKLASKYKTIKDGDDNDYPIYYKAVVNKEDGTKTVDYVAAEITITDTIVKAKDIIFSLNGLKLTATDSITNGNVTIKTLEIPVFTTIGELELLALVKNGTEKQKVIGAMTVIPIKDVGIVNISLVPVNGVTISSDDIVAVQKIYNQAGVTLNITTLPAYQDRSITTLECGTSGFIANYTTEQNAFIDRYKATKTISDNQYLLFVTKDIKPSRPISGFMPLHRQFGFIFTGQSQSGAEEVKETDGLGLAAVIAHEIGHGVFELEHPWEQYDYSRDSFSTNWLMDYASGTKLPYMHWQKISHPKTALYLFQSDSSGEFGLPQLTPNWEPFTYTDSNTYITFYRDNSLPNGCVQGISVNNVDYKWDATKNNYFTNGLSIPLKIDIIKNPSPELVVQLFWMRDKCGFDERYTAKWNYLSDKKGFNIDEVKESGKVTFSDRVPCRVDGVNQGSSLTDTNCDGKDIALLNSQKDAVIALIDNNDVGKITTKINEVDICTIRKLTYEQIEKFIIKISSLSDLDESHEKALLHLMNSIKEEKYQVFFTLLEKDTNKLLKHYLDEFTDHSINPFDGNNYTSLNVMLLKMYQTNPRAWIDRIPAEEQEEYFLDKYFTKPNVKILSLNDLISGSSEIYEQGFQYNPENGKIRITHTATAIQAIAGDNTGAYYAPIGAPKIISTLEVNPLMPVMIDFNNDLQVIEMALNNAGYQKGKEIIIPALFLKFGLDKLNSNTIEKSTLLTMNGLTIVTGLPAIVQGATMAKRLWALAEVAGATGDIVINTDYVQKNYPRVATATNIFNGAMGVVGLKNLITNAGIRSFATNLPSQVKQAFRDSKEIKSIIAAEYLKWKVAAQNLDNLSLAEKELIAKQEKVWRALLQILPERTYLYNPNMANKIRQVVLESGESMEKFVNINYKAANGLANTDEIAWLQKFVTKYFPKPKVDDILRKVMPEEDFIKYYKNTKDPEMSKGAGFVTKVEDYAIPNSSDELIENLRLDYSGTKFSKDKGFVIIEYKNSSPNVEHPFNTSQSTNGLPYTNTGMTGSKHNIIPEYHSTEIVKFNEGDIVKVYDKNGNVIEKYIIENDTLTGLKIWKKQ